MDLVNGCYHSWLLVGQLACTTVLDKFVCGVAQQLTCCSGAENAVANQRSKEAGRQVNPE